MKRTRRAALALVAGSSSLLAVETLGYSSSSVDRSFTADVVDDERAYLGLDEESPNDGQLFDSSREAPAAFDVVNQFTVSIEVAVAFESDGGSENEGAHPTDSNRPDLRVGTIEDGEFTPGVHASLTPGAQQSRLAVDLNPCGISHGELAAERSGTLIITAKNDASDADGSEAMATVSRSFVLESNLLARIGVPWSDAVAVVRAESGAELVVEVVDCPSGETRTRLETGLDFPAILRLIPERHDNSSARREQRDLTVDSIDEIEATVEQSTPNGEPKNGGNGSGENSGNGQRDTSENNSDDRTGSGPSSTSGDGDDGNTEPAEDNVTDEATRQPTQDNEPYVEVTPKSIAPNESDADVPVKTIRVPFPATD
ncbi:uncharacterized protein Nmag_1333 [Natrialba magadii ATCC 43099]|uniref:Uncharacterized protein n=1 Tax=Natrialba magadii (strain ATCC 43099 / DSM 3394 / CCM 3739 / CIP 104546 / IAM 13178 / JCM 8861 / NBRC 102185 / NCIMB 2190 / MS3) TaxID=547559 RepID=D3SSW6_NATMM|nr:hypothetical protein [Natrialba magadii]ADD04912.1 uncharacterized protein Nmag_1333 [Natrialba magadii ATCC 43099]ELY23961.1 hypothetical protein C500_19185 [Natrialba magadii ATCC 43099]